MIHILNDRRKDLVQKLAALITAAVFLSGFFSVYAERAYAYNVENLSVTDNNDFIVEPGKMETFINPGDTVQKYVAVTSRIKGTTDFEVEVEDFIGSRDPNNPVVILENEKSPYSFKDNVKPEIVKFSLAFGQKITIPVTISAPFDAAPGGYLTSILISNAPQKDKEASSSQTVTAAKIISRVGSLFFIRVNGPAHEDGKLSDFKVDGPQKLFYETNPTGFQVLFENAGTVFLIPYGNIEVKNMFGKTVASLPVEAYYSLPNSLRYREIAWNGGYGFGRYTATITLHRGYGDAVDTSTIVFWVLPWKFLGIAFGSIVVIISVVYYITSRFEFRRKS